MKTNEIWHVETQEEVDKEDRAKAEERVGEEEGLGRTQFEDDAASILIDAITVCHERVRLSLGSCSCWNCRPAPLEKTGLWRHNSKFFQPSKSDHHLWNSLCIQALEAVLPVSLRTWVSNLHTYHLQCLCLCKWLWTPDECTASLKGASGTTIYFSVRLECQPSNLG